ncbi:MAG: phenylalanine--tRNA ligase subunit beta [Candidatus Binatia bacterium]
MASRASASRARSPRSTGRGCATRARGSARRGVHRAGRAGHDQAPDLCPRYSARIVRGVTIGPSPLWLRLRLRRAGMRAINAVVDATNYVMLERGQPLHAFDWERIAERVIRVRRAGAGERLVTLDGVERTLGAQDLVIADGRGPVALAGVMGGAHAEVTATTRVLLLESAYFAPTAVRRTSRRLGLGSQASYRFERRVDPAMVPEALDAVATLCAALAGGRVAPGAVDVAPGLASLAPVPVRVRPGRVTSLLGVAVARAEMARRLRALGARSRTEGDALVVTPPSWRSDMRIEADVVEEIARVGGYEAIPVTLPEVPITRGEESAARAEARRLRRLLVGEGLVEMVTLAFTDAETNVRLPGWVGRGLRPVAVRNPLSSETGELRRSPLAGLLRALRTNVDRGAAFVGAFELGKGYGLDAAGQRQEPRAVALVLYGIWPAIGVAREGAPVDLLDLKGVVDNVLAGVGAGETRVRWVPSAEATFLHPGKTATIAVDGTAVGIAGALHPELAQALDLAQEVWLAELDFASLSLYVPRPFQLRPLPRFPAVTRDIAVIVDEAFLADAILQEVRTFDDARIESARLFDCYRGAPIAAGRKSLAYTIAYRAAERTLTDDEVNALHDRLRAHLTARFALELRS